MKKRQEVNASLQEAKERGKEWQRKVSNELLEKQRQSKKEKEEFRQEFS